jgi:hypothetical protein
LIRQGTRGSTLSGSTVGNDNSVDITQYSDNSRVEYSQEGDLNIAQIEQIGYQTNNVASLTQSGLANRALIAQGGESFNGNAASILQQGTANTATLIQQ